MAIWEDQNAALNGLAPRRPAARITSDEAAIELPLQADTPDGAPASGDNWANGIYAAQPAAAQWSEVAYAPLANPTLDDQVTYISGLNPNGTLALYSYAAWKDDTRPADYSGGYTAAKKWYENSSSGTAGTGGGAVRYYFEAASAWSASEKSVFVAALNLWAAAANITFTEVSDTTPGNKITFKRGNDGGAHATLSGDSGSPHDPSAGTTNGTKLLRITGATVSIDTSVNGFGPLTSPATNSNTFSDYGGYPWQVVLHEIGHALGLDHGGPYPVTDGTPSNSLQYSAYDTRLYTIMSYISPSTAGTPFYSQYSPTGTNWGTTNTNGLIYGRQATTYMPLDVQAIQRIYGTPPSTPFSGGQTYGFNTNIAASVRNFYDFTVNTHPVVTLWNSGINNTLDVSGFSSNSTINLNPGTFSSAGTSVNSSGATISMVNNIGIAYDTVIDRVHTGSGNDNVLGNDSNNFIFAGTGTNVINGGGGTADVASYVMNRSAYTLVRTGASVTVNGNSTSDSLTNVEFLAFQDQTIAVSSLPGAAVKSDFDGDGKSDVLWRHDNGQAAMWFATGLGLTGAGPVVSSAWTLKTSSDFSGDGKSDLLWQNGSTGQTEVWVMNGGTLQSTYNLNPGSAAWKVIGAGDFDGDGRGDVLWRHDNGQAALWFATGSGLTGAGPLVSSAWTLKTAADFNGDGKADMIWQNNTTGAAQVWIMNGGSLQSFQDLNPGSSAWKVVGAGDFDGDAKSDVLWRHDNGQAAMWFATGSGLTGAGPQVSSAWSLKNTGDFNGDAKSDLIWQNNTTGVVQVWNMNGGSLQSFQDLNPASSSWKAIAEVYEAPPPPKVKSDFDGDGKSDVLWRHDNGQAAMWLATGSGLTGAGPVVSSAWTLKTSSDFNGDGKSDLLWQNGSTGQTEVWVMNGSSLQSTYNLNPGSAAWKVIGAGDFDGDGRGDVLWRHDNGQAALWFATGSGLVGAGPQVSSAWTLKTAADFNGDGKADMLWQNNTTGVAQVWIMNGNSLQSYYDLNPGSAAWKVAGAGDFDGDGKGDVLWRHDNGQAAMWFATGSGLVGAGPQVSAAWSLKNTGDFNGDTKSDLVWQNDSTGVAQVWVMNGNSLQSYYDLNPASSSWHVVTG